MDRVRVYQDRQTNLTFLCFFSLLGLGSDVLFGTSSGLEVTLLEAESDFGTFAEAESGFDDLAEAESGFDDLPEAASASSN